MEAKYVYFIADPKTRKWFRMNITSLEPHNSNRRDCRCQKCQGNYEPTYSFTDDANLCLQFSTKEKAEMMLVQLKSNKHKTNIGSYDKRDEYFYVDWDNFEHNIRSMDDCVVVEHEFVA